MKNFIAASLKIAVVLFAVATIQSCQTDPCKDVNCGPNGTCFESLCLCDSGYEGDDCLTIMRNKFLGSYMVNENCQGVMFGPYAAEVIVAPEIDQVRIKNMGDFNCEDVNGMPVDYFVAGTVNNGNELMISATECGIEFNGSGTLNTINGVTTIILNYTATYDPGGGIVSDTCVATFMR